MKIAIIGAGASGIVSAIETKRKNPNIKIDLFETNNKIGKKILASGNGRCNISNKNISPKNYMSSNISFVKKIIQNYSFKTDKKFFSSLGLEIEVNKQNKAYPISNDAKSVVNIFQEYLQILKIIYI